MMIICISLTITLFFRATASNKYILKLNKLKIKKPDNIINLSM